MQEQQQQQQQQQAWLPHESARVRLTRGLPMLLDGVSVEERTEVMYAVGGLDEDTCAAWLTLPDEEQRRVLLRHVRGPPAPRNPTGGLGQFADDIAAIKSMLNNAVQVCKSTAAYLLGLAPKVKEQ